MTEFTQLKTLFDISEPCGIDTTELQPWKDKFGAIPKVLTDYYAQLGAHEFNRSQDYLISPDEINEFEDNDYLIFYSENQSVSIWGIHKDDVSKDNPPVYENYGKEEWYQTTDTLTSFLNSMGFLQAVFSMEFSNEEYWNISQVQADEIAKAFKSKNVDSELYTGVRFYGNYDDSVIVIMNNNEGYILMFSSSDEEHFDEMCDIIENIVSKEDEE